ncbi:unnamed protein product [Rotaria magnacalcarata]|uniref:Uncharacterized protein n=1 Tax=Rotaria magnacalcarata TaxID=392030 RepID=A0A816PW89_9BILA|nr:unnamed protein product [Rotaria magnacalcarata]
MNQFSVESKPMTTMAATAFVDSNNANVVVLNETNSNSNNADEVSGLLHDMRKHLKNGALAKIAILIPQVETIVQGNISEAQLSVSADNQLDNMIVNPKNGDGQGAQTTEISYPN